MPFCEIALEGSPVMSSPLKMMRPLVGRSTPVRQLKKVLLPAPFGPMMARTSSRATSKLTCESAASPPNRTDSSSVLRIGADCAPRLVAGEPHRRLRAFTRALTRGELAGRRDDGLVLRHRLEKLVGAALDLEDELAQERLVVFLAQRLVALREVVALLHLEAFERLDQFHGVVAAVELRLLHGDLHAR